MTDLRKAAEMALEVMEYNRANGTPNMGAAIEALRQALAQPVDAVNMSQERVDETAKSKHEPVAWVYNGILHEFDPSEFATSEVKPLYTAPPKREWVGLTDEELKPLCHEWQIIYGGYVRPFAETIEAKLKEKNS